MMEIMALIGLYFGAKLFFPGKKKGVLTGLHGKRYFLSLLFWAKGKNIGARLAYSESPQSRIAWPGPY